MQLFALNNENLPIFANHAVKQKNYFCNECQSVVRLRKGVHRQPHFYHLQTTPACRLNGKGMIHLQVQMNLFNLFPKGECQLEYRMPDIGRIADVVWHPQKIVFEIQCSPISSEEIGQRNKDYQKLGWQVVWILHDNRYNQFKLSQAEIALQNSTHYFTNIDQEGMGIIYDQISAIRHSVRKNYSKALEIDLLQPTRLFTSERKAKGSRMLQERVNNWHLSFQNDLIDSYLKSSHAEEFFQLNEIIYEKQQRLKLKDILYRIILRPYQLIFQLMLEKVCR